MLVESECNCQSTEIDDSGNLIPMIIMAFFVVKPKNVMYTYCHDELRNMAYNVNLIAKLGKKFTFSRDMTFE